MAKKMYDASSIKVLKGLEGVRKRPAMYVGDTGQDGYHHLVYEIVDNSVDEILAGECKSVFIGVGADDVVTIEDDGRGIPVDNHPTENIPTVDVVFTMLHAGGKFGGKDSAFSVSGGLHGVGASVVNALSEWLEVVVWRGGKIYHRRYEMAKQTKQQLDVTGTCAKSKTGTKVVFKPDNSIFKRCEYQKEILERRIRELSFLNKGARFIFKWKDEQPKEFMSDAGLADYAEYLTSKKQKLHQIQAFSGNDIDGCSAECAFVYDSQYDSQIVTFANNINTHEGGVHYNAALDALCKVIQDRADASGELKKLDLTVNKTDVMEGLSLIVSVLVPEPQFGGQTKTKLSNSELRGPLGKWAQEKFDKLFDSDKKLSKIIVDKIIDAMKARDAARKAKSLARKKSVIESNMLAGKLKDCTSKDAQLCEMFIVEGDSAGGTAQNARDRQFQAILPIKGKILNVGKANLNRALQNIEIGSIIAALGITVTPREAIIDELRYHKIIILADADPDGAHISCLLLTLFYNFMRRLIEDGHVYVCDLPLYSVKWRNKSQYLKDDKALEDFREAHPNDHIDVSRFKGLGEMSVEELEETAMSSSTRVLRQIYIDDAVQAQEMLDRLMGNDIEGRKEFLSARLKFTNEV